MSYRHETAIPVAPMPPKNTRRLAFNSFALGGIAMAVFIWAMDRDSVKIEIDQKAIDLAKHGNMTGEEYCNAEVDFSIALSAYFDRQAEGNAKNHLFVIPMGTCLRLMYPAPQPQ